MKKYIFSLFTFLFSLCSLTLISAQDLTKLGEGISIYPNPSITTSFISFYAKNNGVAIFKAYSIEGRQVLNTMHNISKGETKFSVELPKGIYLIQVTGVGYNYSTKFISNNINLNPSVNLKQSFSTDNTDGIDWNKPMKVVSQQKPTVVTSISSITSESVLFLGDVVDGGGSSVTAKGFLWGTTPNPYTRNPISEGAGLGVFSKQINGLTLGTIYYVRAFAKNSYGTTYGNEIVFRAVAVGDNYQGGTVFHLESNGIKGYVAASPEAISQNYWISPPITNIFAGATDGSIGAGENNTLQILSAISDPFYSPPAKYCDTLNLNGYNDWFLPSSQELWAIHSNIYNHLPQREYYWSSTEYDSGNAYALGHEVQNESQLIVSALYLCNKLDNNYKIIPVRHFPAVPQVVTSPIIKVSNTYAESGFGITTNYDFNIISSGLCWSTSPNPTINDNVMTNGRLVGSSPIWQLNNLMPNTTYYVRAFATNSAGTGYGNQEVFTTQSFNFSIGQTYQGGIIGYIFSQGEIGYVSGETHGIIVTQENYSKSWGCEYFPNTSINIGAGMSNSSEIISIMSGCQNFDDYAAKFSLDLVLNGFNDWYLPSLNELGSIYINLYETSENLGYFIENEYWTSSSDTNNGIWYFTFSSNGTVNQSKGCADISFLIRPFRNF